MSWTHSSKIVALGVLLAISLGVAGTAVAVSFSADDPEAAEVGETVEYEVEMTDVFVDQDDQWTVQGETELEDATWEIVAFDVGGDEVDRVQENEFQIDRDENPDLDRVEIRVQGDVPEIEEYNYRNMDEEEYLVMGVSEAGGADLQEYRAHRYTEDSREARQKIDEAVDAVGEDDDRIDSVIALYDAGNFEQAISDAESITDDAESEEQTQSLLLIGGAVVVLLLLAGGGYYVYQQRSQNTNKLQ